MNEIFGAPADIRQELDSDLLSEALNYWESLPVGTYVRNPIGTRHKPHSRDVRNPPQSRHTPGSEPGCVILVKLWQFDSADRTPVRMETDGLEAIAVPDRVGVSVRPLFEDARETVRLESWGPGARVSLAAGGGLELFVLSGGFEQSGECFSGMSWL